MCPPPPAPTTPEPDSGVRYEDSIWAPYARLRTAARIAGLRLDLGEPFETPEGDSLPLGEADETTVRILTDIITTGANLPPGLSGSTAAEPGIDRARHHLVVAAHTAGLDLNPGTPRITADSPRLPLGEADRTAVTGLADLMEAGLAGLITTARALESSFAAHRIAAEQVTAGAGAVDPGEISVPDADALLRLLTGRPGGGSTDPDDQQAGEVLAARIAEGITAVTGGGFADAAYTPFCRRCRGEAAIILFPLTPLVAQRLTVHLEGGVA